MATGKSTWKRNKLLTARRNYFNDGGDMQLPTMPTTLNVDTPQIVYPTTLKPLPGTRGALQPITMPTQAPGIDATQALNNGILQGIQPLPDKREASADVEKNTDQSWAIGGITGGVGFLADSIIDTVNKASGSAIKAKKKELLTQTNNAQLKGQAANDSFDALANDIASTASLKKVDKYDLGAKKAGAIVTEGLTQGMKGAMAGFNAGMSIESLVNGGQGGNKAAYGGYINPVNNEYMLTKGNKYMGGGPIGAIVGGVVGSGMSLIGNLVSNYKARKAAKEVNEQIAYTNDFNDRSLFNRALNLSNAQLSGLEAAYAALGGPLADWDGAIGYSFMNHWLNNKREEAENKGSYELSKLNAFADGGNIHIKPSKKGTFTAAASRHGMGVQEFASKVLANKEDYSPAMVKKANFAKNASKWKHALGGNLMTHGADWDTGLNYIGNGGSHESNPYEGVPMGVDSEGTPNLVEEGETIWNDYVFSRRLMVPKSFMKKYKLGGKLSFADASLKLAKESEERPNDPISQRGLDALMSDLAMAQEELKAKRQQNRFANGGRINRFDGESTDSNFLSNPNSNWIDEVVDPLTGKPVRETLYGTSKTSAKYDLPSFLQYANGYKGSMSSSTKAGAYGVDRNFFNGTNPYIFGKTTISDLERDSAYDAFTQEVLNNPTQYYDYLRMLDSRTASSATKLFDGDNLREGWDKLFLKRRTDGDAGVYHLTPLLLESIGADPVSSEPVITQPQVVEPEIVTPQKEDGYIFRENGQWRRWTPEDGDDPRLSLMNRGYFERDNKINGTGGTDYYFDLDEEVPKGKFYDWLRYAPAVGFGIGALVSGLSKPDYSSADAILEAARGARTYQPVSFNPIGNYLAYNPLDREFYINQMNAQSGATRRAALQNAGLNRGAGMAALLAADNNYLGNLGKFAREAEEYNLAQRERVEDFNRKTNMFNSEGIFQADTANQKAQMASGEHYLKGVMAAANLRQSIKDQKDAALAANLSGLFQTLGDIGREEYDYKLLDPLIQREILGRGTAKDYGRSNIGAKGGKLKRVKRKGFTI